VDQSSPNLASMYRSDRCMQPVFQSIVSCTNVKISAIKSQNGELKTTFFGPKIFGRRTPKIRCGHFCSYRDTSSRKVWCNFHQQTGRYKPKYTIFLVNFRILGVKKFLGADTSPVRCALASVRHPLATVKFLGAKPLSPEI